MRIYVNEIKIKDDGIYCYSEDPTDGLVLISRQIRNYHYQQAFALLLLIHQLDLLSSNKCHHL
jgi:hypothetical protein